MTYESHMLSLGFSLIFTPPPSDISIGKEAVFNCYNEVYLEPLWYINGLTLIHPSNAGRADITAIGTGTTNITLIIDGIVENYGTTIQCLAIGQVDGKLQSNTSQLYTLYITGMTKLTSLSSRLCLIKHSVDHLTTPFTMYIDALYS